MHEKESESGPQLSSTARSRSLLVCEDNDSIRSTLQRTLTVGGHRVLSAAHPEEALRLAASNGTIDLLITDVTLPQMSGQELSARIKERSPGLCVLYISGYSRDLVNTAQDGEPEPAFLQKPFTPAELLQKVAAILAPPDTAAGGDARPAVADTPAGDNAMPDLADRPTAPGGGKDVCTATGDSVATPPLRRRGELDALWRRFATVEIASRVAHELKQPLTAIALHCDAALTTASGQSATAPELVEDLREAASQAFRAGGIVNDLQRLLLDFETNRRAAQVNPLLVEARRIVESETAGQNMPIELHLEKDLPPVCVDHSQIILALTGLIRIGLESAKKKDGVPPRVNLSSSLRGTDIVISVEAPGSGLAPEDLHFGYRAGGAAGDLGLELAICRRIVAAHGGQLTRLRTCAQWVCYGFSLSAEIAPPVRAPDEALPEASD